MKAVTGASGWPWDVLKGACFVAVLQSDSCSISIIGSSMSHHGPRPPGVVGRISAGPRSLSPEAFSHAMTISPCLRTPTSAYFFRSRFRSTIAVRFRSSTIRSSSSVGGEDHRPRRVHVGRLEAHVVDVEAEVHELPVQVEERPEAVTGRAGASFTTPVIMSGATSPAARAMARMSPVRIDGMTAGSTTRQRRLELRGAQRQGGLAHPPGNGRQPLLGRHDDHRHGQERQGQRRPQDAAGAEGRRRAAPRGRRAGRCVPPTK